MKELDKSIDDVLSTESVTQIMSDYFTPNKELFIVSREQSF